MFNFFRKKENKPLEKEGKVRAHLFVSGRVQGVFFRENTKQRADKLGVFGWVKNLKSGKVEAVLEGERERVEKMVNWAKRGPFLAQVKHFNLNWEDYQEEFKNFEIRYEI